ncbi:MAG: hypothetical protein K6E59_06145 [Bacilli bacterium]|nr:hypothetical protein [Bacilli bacterium]
MKLFGILTIVFALFCVAGVFLSLSFKAKLLLAARIGLGVSYALFLLFLLLWANQLYEGGNLPLAFSTFAVGGLLCGTIILGILLKENKIATWVTMVSFLVLAITFIVLAVFLSKTVIQPNGTLV